MANKQPCKPEMVWSRLLEHTGANRIGDEYLQMMVVVSHTELEVWTYLWRHTTLTAVSHRKLAMVSCGRGAAMSCFWFRTYLPIEGCEGRIGKPIE